MIWLKWLIGSTALSAKMGDSPPLRVREFSDLPEEVQLIWDQNRAELIRNFTGIYHRPWVLRCREHPEEVLLVNVSKQDINASTFVVDERGVKYSYTELASLPTYSGIGNTHLDITWSYGRLPK